MLTCNVIDKRTLDVLYEFYPTDNEHSLHPFFVSDDELVWISWRKKEMIESSDFSIKDYDAFVTRWQRRRPEWWWGVAWLPEFWLTAVFGIALIWSLRRDWKTLRGKKVGAKVELAATL